MKARLIVAWQFANAALVCANLGYALFALDWPPDWMRAPMGVSCAAYLMWHFWQASRHYAATRRQHTEQMERVSRSLEKQ